MSQKKVGIWIRVSTIDQAKGESPEHHEKRAKIYADFKEWEVVEVYHLEAVSGKSVLEHPEARRMIHDIKRGHISGLIFSKIARLARNTKELIEISELFTECNADLISLQESIDTSSPSGRFFYTMIAAMAQWEREEIADRVSASIPVRAKLGKSLGGAIPFGYTKDEKGQIVINEPEAGIRRLMFDLFLEHKKNQKVANILNGRGYRTRNGAMFKHSTIDRLLRDPIAKGIRRMNYTKSLGKGKTWKVKPKEDWVFHEVPALVDSEVWDKVNAILEDSDTKREPRKRSTVHLFSGILKCSCGGMMYMRSRSPRYVCQNCKNKIMPDDIEQVYKEEIKAFVFSDEEIKKQFDKDHKEVSGREEEIKRLKQKSEELSKKIDSILDLYHSGEIKKDSFKSYHEPLEKQQEQITERIGILQGEIEGFQNTVITLDFFIQDMRNLSSYWDMMSHEEKHKTIQMTTADIIVSNETPDIEINMKYNPQSFENVTNNAHNRMVVCTSCYFRLKGSKPPVEADSIQPRTLGDHLRKIRLKRKLSQPQVAKILNVSDETILSWEKNNTKPTPKDASKIIKFLGYFPFEWENENIQTQVNYARMVSGHTQECMAKEILVDESSLNKILHGKSKPRPDTLEKIDGYISRYLNETSSS